MSKHYKFKEEKYQHAIHTDDKGRKVVVAWSTYAGKIVHGRAKCSANDEFSLEKGKKLARARCNARIAKRRRANAERLLEEAKRAKAQAEQRYIKMLHYYTDACDSYINAEGHVNLLLEQFNDAE